MESNPLIVLSKSIYAEVFFSVRDVSNIYMQPSVDSPIIYPIEQGKKLILKTILLIGGLSE